MPPRKSNVSQASGAGDDGTPAKEKSDGVNIEDLALPRTMVQRLAKGVLPPNTQIQKDAITAFSKSATMFVNYLSSAANDRAMLANRKTISPTNVLEALADCELEIFLPRVEAELRKFNEIQTGKRNEYRRKLKEGKEGTDGKGAKKEKEAGGSKLEDDGDEGEERAAKRVRRDGGDAMEPGPQDQLVERIRGKESDNSMDGADEAMEGDTMEAAEDDDVDEQREDDDGSEAEEDEEEEEEEEEDERDEVADMDSRLRNLQARMSSSGSSRAPSPTSDYSQDGDDSD